MAHYDFEKDLPTGENGEQVVARTLYEYKGWYPVKFNKTKEYDILMQPEGHDSDLLKVEVKTDVYPHDTGNLLIERRNKGRQSGINTTEADYWAYLYPHHPACNLWLIETDKLKKLISEYNFYDNREEGYIVEKWVGDNKDALCWLIPRSKYAIWFEMLTAFL
jgi:hypothetical protein|tara:strand:+ start:59 stop:547 length:489 start_codon:yes stop_codon:yes gene_type:complete